jgi:hypothetical protein
MLIMKDGGGEGEVLTASNTFYNILKVASSLDPK